MLYVCVYLLYNTLCPSSSASASSLGMTKSLFSLSVCDVGPLFLFTCVEVCLEEGKVLSNTYYYGTDALHNIGLADLS